MRGVHVGIGDHVRDREASTRSARGHSRNELAAQHPFPGANGASRTHGPCCGFRATPSKRLDARRGAIKRGVSCARRASAGRRRAPEARDQLTPQELQIAQLAAEGLSNREIGQRLFLSHRTISTHLYRVFPKLGITSCAELSGALGPGLRT